MTHNTEIYSDCKPRKLAACPEITSGVYPLGMANWAQMTVTERLKVLRKTLNLGQEQFAVEIGADPDSDAYGKAERTGNISQMAPLIYRRFPQIDAGWLFQGLEGNVHSAFKTELEAAAGALGLDGMDRRRR